MIEGYKEKLSKYLNEVEIIKRENRWVGIIKITKKLQKFMKTVQNSEAMKQVNITKSVLQFKEATKGIILQGDQEYVDNIKVNKMIVQRLRDKNKVIDEVKEECKQIIDEVNKKNEELHKKYHEQITILEGEIGEKTSQFQSQIEILTQELKNKEEIIQEFVANIKKQKIPIELEEKN